MIASFLIFLLQAAAPAQPAARPPQTRATVEAEVKAAFQQRDTNKDGKVDRNEANAFIASQRAAAVARNRQNGTEIFNKGDTNKDKVLSLQEFLTLGAPVPEIKDSWFDANDNDRNGRVEMAEAVAHGNRNFDAYDTNRDGLVTNEELLAAVRKAQAAAANQAPATPRPANGR